MWLPSSFHVPHSESCAVRLEFDQCAALNALGGPCAIGAILSAGTAKAAVQGAFANERNLYFFYAAENKERRRTSTCGRPSL